MANKIDAVTKSLPLDLVNLYLSSSKHPPTIIESNTFLKLFASHFLQDNMIHINKNILSLTEYGVDSTHKFISKNLPCLYSYMSQNDVLKLQELSEQVLIYSNKQLKQDINTLISERSADININYTYIYIIFLELLLSLIEQNNTITPFLKKMRIDYRVWSITR